MSTQDAIDAERERLLASLSAMIYRTRARGEFEDARTFEALLQDFCAGNVAEWLRFPVETQERAGQAQGRAV